MKKWIVLLALIVITQDGTKHTYENAKIERYPIGNIVWEYWDYYPVGYNGEMSHGYLDKFKSMEVHEPTQGYTLIADSDHTDIYPYGTIQSMTGE